MTRQEWFAEVDRRFQEWLDRRGYDYNPIMGRVGPGWLPVLDRLCDDIEQLGWDKGIAQIKEKFGGLRFYARGSSPPGVQCRINAAERESLKVCEHCGKAGRLGGDGWVKTLCESCRIEEKEMIRGSLQIDL